MEENLLSRLVFFGAGAQNLRLAWMHFGYTGYKALFVCDNDTNKQGGTSYGLKIEPPEKLRELDGEKEEYAVVITAFSADIIASIRESIDNLGLKYAKVYTLRDITETMHLNKSTNRLPFLAVDLQHNCNLKCKACYHFMPLAKEPAFNADLDDFEAQMAKLGILTGGDVEEIQWAGGEPLLHPQIERFPYAVRKYFPNTDIVLVTNGIDLMKMKDDFFKACLETGTKIQITRYPIDLPYDTLFKEVEARGIKVEFGNTGDLGEGRLKMMERYCFNISGRFDREHSFDICPRKAIIVRENKLYPCPLSAFLDLPIDYYNLDIDISKAGGVDFMKAGSLSEVTDALSRPLPLCAHCDWDTPRKAVEWGISEREMSEWIADEENYAAI